MTLQLLLLHSAYHKIYCCVLLTRPALRVDLVTASCMIVCLLVFLSDPHSQDTSGDSKSVGQTMIQVNR